MMAIAKRVLLAGGHPSIFPTFPGYEEMFYKTASDEQLKFIPPHVRNYVETYERRFAIISESNTKELIQYRSRPHGDHQPGVVRLDENLHGTFSQ